MPGRPLQAEVGEVTSSTGSRPTRVQRHPDAARWLPAPDVCQWVIAEQSWGCVVLDLDARVCWGNAAAEELTGHALRDVIGQPVSAFVAPASAPMAHDMLSALHSDGPAGISTAWAVERPDGTTVWLEIGAKRLPELAGGPPGGGTVLRLRPWDTQRYLSAYLTSLATSERFEDTLRPLVLAIQAIMRGGEVSVAYDWNGTAFARAISTDLPPSLSGSAPALGPGSVPLPWVEARLLGKAVDLADLSSLPTRTRATAADRGLRACWTMPVVVPSEEEPSTVIILWRHETGAPGLLHAAALRQVHELAAVTFERHRADVRLIRAATTDPLTGIANRLLFFAALEAELRTPDREEVAVLYLDLDGFKQVNDSYGHRTGDHLLTAVAARLETCLRPQDLVARLGGDEFAVICRHVTHVGQASAVAERLIRAVTQPFAVPSPRAAKDGPDTADTELSVGVSIGIALAQDHGLEADALVDAADAALYVAKETGRGTWRLAAPPV